MSKSLRVAATWLTVASTRSAVAQWAPLVRSRATAAMVRLPKIRSCVSTICTGAKVWTRYEKVTQSLFCSLFLLYLSQSNVNLITCAKKVMFLFRFICWLACLCVCQQDYCNVMGEFSWNLWKGWSLGSETTDKIFAVDLDLDLNSGIFWLYVTPCNRALPVDLR